MLVRNNASVARTFEWTPSPKAKKARMQSITETKSKNHFEENFPCLETEDIRGHKGCVNNVKWGTEINQNAERENDYLMWLLGCNQWPERGSLSEMLTQQKPDWQELSHRWETEDGETKALLIQDRNGEYEGIFGTGESEFIWRLREKTIESGIWLLYS